MIDKKEMKKMVHDAVGAYFSSPGKLHHEIYRLREQNEKILDGMRDTIRERDILSGENYDLRKENEKLRKDVKTAIMGDSAELADAKREITKLTSAYKNGYHEALEAAAELAFKILTEIEGIDFEVPAKIRELHAAALKESGDD